LYLINSPVVRAETLKFKEQGVKDVIKDVFLPWFNAYRFFVEAVLKYNKVVILLVVSLLIEIAVHKERRIQT
jgi:hypothetical protein